MKDTTDPARPMQVVFIDHSYYHQIGWVEKFARTVSGLNVILLTDKQPSRINANFEVINVRDVAQQLDLEALQKEYDFSIYKALTTERAYFDYTTFSSSQCYSRVDLQDIAQLIGPYVNALDYVIRTRADLVISHLSDNAIASLAAHIARNYGKPCAAAFPYYWWSDGYLFVDRPDLTSSQVDALYRKFYADQESIDRGLVEELYSTKRASMTYPDTNVYRLSARVRKIFASRGWHEPFSLRNWLMRRAGYLVSRVLMKCFTRSYPNVQNDKPYVLFPMHVAPEASLLGPTPELADQFSLIKNISINLPWGVRLCVKGHPAQVKWTGPGFDFYRKLGTLQNVDVIDASAPLTEILRDERCLAVAAINGTVGLEAAINRKPVFIFGRAIYGIADCFFKPKSYEEFGRQMLAILRGEFEWDEGAILSILAALNASVWRGNNDFALADNAEQASLRSFSTFEAYIRSQTWRTKPIVAEPADKQVLEKN
jgi:hypothetical protein